MAPTMAPNDDIAYTAIPPPTDGSTARPLPNSIEHAKKPSRWYISSRTPLSMPSLFIAGILVCVGHHLFYSRLDGTAVQYLEDGSQYRTQIWIIRYGTAFAFLAKALLAGAVVVGYKQHIWINLRQKDNSVSTIDAMFAATYDPIAFISPGFIIKAKLPALMALVAWYCFQVLIH